MKLAFSTLGCPNWSFEQVLDQAQRMRFDAIEIRGIEGQMEASEIPWLMPGRQQTTRNMLRDCGLSICAFGSSISFHDLALADRMRESGRQTIDICANMDIPYMRVFGNNIPNGMSQEDAAARVADGINALCDYAQGTDVRILLEVHGDFNTVEIIGSVIEKMNHEKAGILWDIAHSDRVYKEDFLPFYETIKPYLYHVHIKDHKRLPDGRTALCHVGDGDIPIRQIRNVLLKDGYKGYFSLEWEKKWHPELAEPEQEFPTFRAFMEE